MMRSLYSGISGLAVHQTKMDVIGNNIANVNTTAFKSSRVTFNEVFSQTLKSASASSELLGGQNAQQIGLGANINSIDILMTEGAVQRTDNELDLKIEGDGFFVVRDASGFKFTRDGSFKVDESGYLVNASGLFVCGWNADKEGEINKSPVEPLQVLTANTYTIEPVQTTEVEFVKNINIEDGSTDGTGIPQLTNFYDSLGNKYTMKTTMYYFKDKEAADAYDLANGNTAGTTAELIWGAGAAQHPATWAMLGIDSITDSEGNEVEAAKPITDNPPTYDTLANVLNQDGDNNKFPILFTFDEAGKFSTLQGDTSSILELDFSAACVDGTNSPIKGITSLVGTDKKMAFDFKGLTQYNTQTTAAPNVKDGNAPGTFSRFSIGSDGVISASYSNGATKILGQISLATFDNAAGLEKVGGNLFATTMNSGEFDGVGVTPDSVGSLNPGALEMSNVDLSKEFTEMITTQRGFQANSRIITTSDTLLEELTNLKR